jgi:hypothetical protein
MTDTDTDILTRIEEMITSVPGIQDALDDLVLDEFTNQASAVINAGYEDEVEFLLSNRTEEELLKALESH